MPCAISIDCRSHTMQPISGFSKSLKSSEVAYIIDGKTSVIDSKGVMVFDTETQKWDPVNKWELGEMLNSEEWWDACVVNDELYFYDVKVNEFKVYDPKQRCWRVVRGLEELLSKMANSWSQRTVSYGGKMVRREQGSFALWGLLWKRRQGGEFWGKVQWCDVVFNDGDGTFNLFTCIAVMV
ncbi:unnamed protein product [Thlaspi arvense]|uniref:FKB95-like N-terminal Kelch domain-containing protein n=1 Tax=Thlaspi arvense TaxID=13288 RepID=A0AAU9STB5_THLAR|nr:unnamed protein product [Thlaspi arvense]